MSDGTPPVADNGSPPAPDTGTGTPPADNGTPTAWYADLPEDIRGDANITKYDSLEKMARGHMSAVSMIGRDKLAMPKTDEEYREVYSKLGMPATAADYKLDEVDYGLPEDFYSKEAQAQDINMYRGWAHEEGLSEKQANNLYHKWMGMQAEIVKGVETRNTIEMARCSDMMNEVWGEARTANLTIANRALETYFGKDVVEAVNASGLGRNFNFLQGLYNLGSQRLEELGVDKRGAQTRTPAELDAQISELQGHAAYLDATHPEHKLVNDQVLALMERKRKNS